MRYSDIFRAELALFDDVRLADEVARLLDDVVPDYFWLVAASSSGKYHPWYSLGYGGLVRHTKAAVKIASDLLELEQYRHLSKDYILAALILHDTFKHGLNGEQYTVFEHPLVAASQVYKNCLPEFKDDMYEISVLIASHMGQWTSVENKPILPAPVTEDQKFVHLCDFLASRRYITVEVI